MVSEQKAKLIILWLYLEKEFHRHASKHIYLLQNLLKGISFVTSDKTTFPLFLLLACVLFRYVVEGC